MKAARYYLIDHTDKICREFHQPIGCHSFDALIAHLVRIAHHNIEVLYPESDMLLCNYHVNDAGMIVYDEVNIQRI